jgi:hypothetical protein
VSTLDGSLALGLELGAVVMPPPELSLDAEESAGAVAEHAIASEEPTSQYDRIRRGCHGNVAVGRLSFREDFAVTRPTPRARIARAHALTAFSQCRRAATSRTIASVGFTRCDK